MTLLTNYLIGKNTSKQSLHIIGLFVGNTYLFNGIKNLFEIRNTIKTSNTPHQETRWNPSGGGYSRGCHQGGHTPNKMA
jgi:hypothetical protein